MNWNNFLSKIFLEKNRHFNYFICIIVIIYPLIMPDQAIYLGFVSLEYVLFALGLNVIVGWTGLLDLGAAGFIAVGAYTTAILSTQLGLPALLILPLTFIIGFISGIILGIPTLRHRADYFAILTMGFAELVALTIRNWPSLTKGSYGYSGIPPTSLPFFKESFKAVPPIGFYYLALTLVIICYYSINKIRNTSLGRYFHVIKHNEIMGKCYGINIILVKIAAFGLSAGMLSIGGFFWASYQRSIVWTEFGVFLSCMLLSLLVIGGIGNSKGVVLGAIIIGTSSELLRGFLTTIGLPQNIRFLIFSTALIIFIQFRPKGIIPDNPEWMKKYGHFDIPFFKPKAIEIKNFNVDTPILEIKNLKKSFGGVNALKNFSFKAKLGENIAFIGPNGSGKSTLINLISGILKPDMGEILFKGIRIEKIPSYKIANMGLRRSFQELSVLDDISIEDNVFLTTANIDPKNVREFIRRFGFGKEKQLCSNLSYGEKKSLDLIRLFVEKENVNLVLLDEPTAGLTQREALFLVENLFQLKKEKNITLIIISHDILFLNALTVDRLIVLSQGEIFKEGDFESIKNDVEVKNLFWGD